MGKNSTYSSTALAAVAAAELVLDSAAVAVADGDVAVADGEAAAVCAGTLGSVITGAGMAAAGSADDCVCTD